LSNSLGSKNPSPIYREQPVRNLPKKSSRTSHSTTNRNRLPPAVDSLISVRSFTGTNRCLGRGPMQRRAQWAVYSPARSALSTPDVNKSSHRIKNLEPRRNPDFYGPNAVLEPQSRGVLAYIGTESPFASGGGRRREYPGKANTTHVHFASLTRTDNFEEICTLLTFVISAALSAFCREYWCGTPRSCSPLGGPGTA
jgi:hypothetical protein